MLPFSFLRDAGEIERAITAFARSPNGGMIVAGSTLAGVHRDLIVTLAARHKLPTVYFARYFVAIGGLISYGPGLVDQYRDVAGYVDRILQGEKPADLPVHLIPPSGTTVRALIGSCHVGAGFVVLQWVPVSRRWPLEARLR